MKDKIVQTAYMAVCKADTIIKISAPMTETLFDSEAVIKIMVERLQQQYDKAATAAIENV